MSWKDIGDRTEPAMEYIHKLENMVRQEREKNRQFSLARLSFFTLNAQPIAFTLGVIGGIVVCSIILGVVIMIRGF